MNMIKRCLFWPDAPKPLCCWRIVVVVLVAAIVLIAALRGAPPARRQPIALWAVNGGHSVRAVRVQQLARDADFPQHDW